MKIFSCRVWLLVAFIATVSPSTAPGQSDSARIVRLEAKVDTLMRVIGEFRVRPDLAVACIELPNGECPVLYRQRQLGVAADAAYTHTIPGFQAQISGLATRLAMVESRPATGGSAVAGTSVTDQGNGELVFTGKDTGGQRQDNIRGDFKAILGINNFDSGFRLLVNWGCVIPQLPFWTIGADSHGAFSYNGAPCPTGTWSADQTYGQAFVIDGGWSQRGYSYDTGQPYKPSVLIASQRGGMDILFAVTPWRVVGQPVLNKTVMILHSDGSANPVSIVLDGQIRRLKACGNTVCF